MEIGWIVKKNKVKLTKKQAHFWSEENWGNLIYANGKHPNIVGVMFHSNLELDYPVVVIVENSDGFEHESYSLCGSCFLGEKNALDLKLKIDLVLEEWGIEPFLNAEVNFRSKNNPKEIFENFFEFLLKDQSIMRGFINFLKTDGVFNSKFQDLKQNLEWQFKNDAEGVWYEFK